MLDDGAPVEAVVGVGGTALSVLTAGFEVAEPLASLVPATESLLLSHSGHIPGVT